MKKKETELLTKKSERERYFRGLREQKDLLSQGFENPINDNIKRNITDISNKRIKSKTKNLRLYALRNKR